MGAKSSKGGKTPTSPKGGAAASPKIVLPPKKVKKDSPYDLTYFIFLGGIVIDEFIEAQREPSNVKVLTDRLEPPKPISAMTEQERKDWEAEVEKHEKKLAMQKLMEKNLQLKIQHGDKPVAPPVKGGIIGKAKKKMQQTQEKMAAKADEATKHTDTVEERVKKQALAGAQGSLTGGATASLGQDIAKSQQIKDLEKKRKDFAKQEELRKKQEEEAKKKAEEEKKKKKPKGLADFLNEVEGQETPGEAAARNTGGVRKSAGPAAKLNAFLSQVEGPAYALDQQPTRANDNAVPEEPDQADADGPTKQSQGNKLTAFLASAEGTQERPKSEGKFAGFLGATVKRLSFKPADVQRIDLAPENVMDAMQEDGVAGENGEEEPIEEGQEEDTRPLSDVEVEKPTEEQQQAQAKKLNQFLSEAESSGSPERPKSEGKFSGFLGATVRRLTFKPADPQQQRIDLGTENVMETMQEDEAVAEENDEKPDDEPTEEEDLRPISAKIEKPSEEQQQAQAKKLNQFLAEAETTANTERPKSEGKFSGFLGATVRRLTFKPAEGNRVDVPLAPEDQMDTLQEDASPEDGGEEPTANEKEPVAAAE